MWMNEEVVHETLSESPSIREVQMEAWHEYIQNGDLSTLIRRGIEKLDRRVGSMYREGDIIVIISPEDGASEETALLLRYERGGTPTDAVWHALIGGERCTLPLRRFIAEDHWLLSSPHI